MVEKLSEPVLDTDVVIHKDNVVLHFLAECTDSEGASSGDSF